MAGAPETTVVGGQRPRPGPAQARTVRHGPPPGTETRFAALLEPYGEEPRVTAFTAGGAWPSRPRVSKIGVSFEDGVLRYVRRAAGKFVRFALAGAVNSKTAGRS